MDKKINLEQVTQLLNYRVQSHIERTTFNIGQPLEVIEQLLHTFYIAEIRKTRREPIINEDKKQILLQVAKWIVKYPKTGLILCGPVGSGKTTIANALCSMINYLFEGTQSRVWQIGSIDLVATAKQKTAQVGASYELYKKSPMLLIDDLGVESDVIVDFGDRLQPMVDLIYWRYKLRLFTIVTTNLNDEAIKTKYGDRIADRITEMFNSIAIVGDSYRQL